MTIGSVPASLSAQEQQKNPAFEVHLSLLHLMQMTGDKDCWSNKAVNQILNVKKELCENG
jgi:hypothetical protein